MKIDIQTDSESQVQGFENSQMGFDTSKWAKMFHMFSNTTYTNKPAAVIRELCSNAFDSHKAAGKLDVPFEIVLPSYQDPVLIIRDFGLGLTKDHAKKTILCYLGSDKDDSSDFIGGWGIGSKSPFAYAKNYEVVIRKDGVRVHFTCWKDENGLPHNAVMDEGPTDEGNGVEMHVPIEPEDISTFATTINQYMKWTNYNVVLRNRNSDTKYPPRQIVEESNFNGARMCLYEEGTGAVRIVYGGYSYNVEACLDNRWGYDSDWQNLIKNMLSYYDIAVIVDTPDALNFSMSREHLELTPKTKKFVMEMVSFLLEQSQSQKKLFDSSVDNWFSDALDLTLVEFDEKVAEILEENNTQDRIFARAFKNYDKSVKFMGSLRKYTYKRGPKTVYELALGIRAVKEQIRVVWCRRLTVPKKYRIDTDEDVGITVDLFVKGSTLEEAQQNLSANPLFVGFDVTQLNWMYIDVPLPERRKYTSSSSASDRESVPRLYCNSRKAYIKWDDDVTFVYEDDSHSYHTRRIALLGTKNKAKFIFCDPTKNFMKKWEGDLENLMSAEEFVDEYHAAGADFYEKYGRVGPKLLGHLARLADSLNDVAYNPFLKINEAEVKRYEEKVNDFYSNALRVIDIIGPYDDKEEQNAEALGFQIDVIPYFKRHVLASALTPYLNVNRIVADKDKSIAKFIREALKIDEILKIN